MNKGFESINIHGCANAVVPVPTIGENGNWFIGNDDTGISAKGERGEIGLKARKATKEILECKTHKVSKDHKESKERRARREK